MSFLIDTDTCSAQLKVHGIVTNRFLQYTLSTPRRRRYARAS